MLHRNTKHSGIELIEDEFAQEKASALGRLGDASNGSRPWPGSTPVMRAKRRLQNADNCGLRSSAKGSLALWNLVVQREACGLRDTRYLLRDYRVPPEVAARMGLPGRRQIAAAQADRPLTETVVRASTGLRQPTGGPIDCARPWQRRGKPVRYSSSWPIRGQQLQC